MAIKLAFGSAATTISGPAAGTIKTSSPVTSAVGSSISSVSKSDTTAVEKTESALPAEIIAIVDFNRVHTTAGKSKDSMTPYGTYYNALDSVHSITTEDVTYVVSKALANDSSGTWSSLKKVTDADSADATDFVEDLSNFLDKIEQAEKSLDFCREADPEIQQESINYLSSKLKIYEKKAEDRTFDALNVIGQSSLTNKNVDSLKELLTNLKNTLTKENIVAYNTIINGLSQKTVNDLNAKTGDEHAKAFKLIDTLAAGVVLADSEAKLLGCAEILSRIFLLSSGIVKVNNDPISSRISFDKSNIAAIFDGTSPDSNVPFRKKLANGNLDANTVTLSLIQYDDQNNKTVIPIETEDSATQSAYKSGPNALIRAPFQDGDYTFANFDAFSAQFEKNRVELETYLELTLGYLDPKNNLTPSGILRTIIESFVKGLDLAMNSQQAFFELHAFALAARAHAEEPDGEELLDSAGESVGVLNLRQELLRSVSIIKDFRLAAHVSTSQGEEGSQYPVTLSTTKSSPNSESLDLTTATIITTQVENKSPAAAARDIERRGSSSPASIIEQMIHRQILSHAKDGGMSELERVRELEIAKSRIEVTKDARLRAADEGLSTVKLSEKIDLLEEYIAHLNDISGNTQQYTSKDVVVEYYNQMRRATNGTFTSTLLDTYETLIDAAKSRLPDDSRFTDENGLTVFGTLDEHGIISFLVECYVILASKITFTSSKDSLGNVFIPMINPLISLLKIDLNAILAAGHSADLDNISYDDAPGVSTVLSICARREQLYQNSLAYLSAFSSMMNNAKNNLKTSTADLLNSAGRRKILDTTSGRKMLESLTSQQIIYRRALIDRYRPNPSFGYLPARLAYSADESSALNFILSSQPLSDRSAENIRIVFAGIPVGTISSKRYVNQDIDNIKFSGMIELAVHHHDHEFEDLIFKEKIFLFDPQLYVTPDSLNGYLNVKSSATSDATLSLAKRMRFTLYDRSGSQVLDYTNLKSNERYKDLDASQIDTIIKNTLLSYLLETYTFKLSGMLFDESVSLQIDDTISAGGYSAIGATAAQGLPDLKLPTTSQLATILGADSEISFTSAATMSSGDRELISAIASSYLVKTEKPIDRLLAPSAFDRIFAVPVDPDDFEIDQQQSIKENGTLAKTMLESLVKQELIIQKGSATYFRPRDPSSGGFSIGNISVQFIPHTIGKEEGTLLRVAKTAFNSKSNSTTLKLTTIKSARAASTSSTSSSAARTKL